MPSELNKLKKTVEDNKVKNNPAFKALLLRKKVRLPKDKMGRFTVKKAGL